MKVLLRDVTEDWWCGNSFTLRATTRRRKREILDKHILPFFDGCDISEIDDVLINQFIWVESTQGNRLNHQPLSEGMVYKEMHILKSIFQYAYLKEIINKNPFQTIKLKRPKHQVFEIYTPKEVEDIIHAARPKYLGDIILLSYHTGMRKGECYGLQWQDIDWSKHVIQVNRSVTATEPRERLVSEPKTSSSKREILMDEVTILMLQRRKGLGLSNIWVFANQYGEPLSPWYSVRDFRIASNKARVYGKRFHDLRHTHITELVAAGIPLPVIQKRVGHSNISTTMRYVHIGTDMQQGIVDFLNMRNEVIKNG